MIKEFNKISGLKGTLNLPGDKSISHRSVIFGAMAEGKSTVKNCLMSADVISTINVFRAVGCKIEIDGTTVTIEGKGSKKFEKPSVELDMGNSGTAARLLSGVFAAQDFESTFIGDESLSSRPMKRIIAPLSEMGAKFEATEKLTMPMTILPSQELHSIVYKLPMASAQVKSAVLLAGLHLDETTKVVEPIATRNHTENMLGMPVEKTKKGNVISVNNSYYPKPKDYLVPSDISTAAFFIVLASIVDGAEVTLKNVLMNETRNGIVTVMQQMGADITISNENAGSGEKVADLTIRKSNLKNIEFDKSIIPNIIDEIPILTIAGLFAEGNFVIKNAEELRVKETDRIHAMCYNLRLLGLDVDEKEDGFSVSGDINSNKVEFDSFDDHRISMAFAILSMMLEQGGMVKEFDCCKISNPNFLVQVESLTKCKSN